jgi:hypothetical protein
MPLEFENMRKKILKSLKKQYPNLSDKELESKSYAIATSQWKKSHGGKSPTEQAKIDILEYFVPIKESATVDGEFRIKGIAISETTTSNNHRFIAEELRKSVNSLNGVPLLVDHNNTVESIKGRVINSFFDELNKNIIFEAKVMDAKIKEMIKDGRINSVSIGATVGELQEDEEGSLIAKNINFKELSLVAVPADSQATFEVALKEFYRKIKEEEPEPDYDEDEDELEYEYETEEAQTSEMETKQSYSQKDIIQLKGGSTKVETESKETSELDLLKQKMAEQEKVIAEYKAKEREELIASYKRTCEEKSVDAMDVSNLDDSAIKMLIAQVSSIKKSTQKAEVEVAELAETETSEFQIVESSGTLSGGAFTIVRSKY